MGSERTPEELAKELHGILMKDATYELKLSVRKWLLIRDETIATIEEIIALLHKTSKDVTISNVVGSSVGAVGGAIIIGGLIAAPFTAGVSLIPTAIAGGVTAGLGGATAIGSSIAGLVIDKNQVDQWKRCIEKDRNRLEKLETEIECYQNYHRLVKHKIEQTVHPQSGSYVALDWDTAGPRLGCNIASMVATGIAVGSAVAATKTAGRVAGTGAVVGIRTSALVVAHSVAVAGFGLDIAMIAFNGVKLSKGAKSDTGIQLEEAVKALKDERDQFIKEYLQDPSDNFINN